MTLTQEPRPADAKRSGFRPDIQGMRALAVGAVVLYHFWPERLTGGFVGVDVFFVISGFLITAHLISKPPKNIKDVGQFWMRRVKRLLPASFLVILCSVIGIWTLAPNTLWSDWGLQALAATFYFQNWFLATSKVDYMAESDAPSPFQHFWSLSVEEQFYFIWPIMIGLTIWAAIKFGKSQKPLLFAVLGTVFVGGLAFSTYSTAQDSGVAYFSTFTRCWEFAVGALVAAFGPGAYRAKSDKLSLVAAWAGLLAILLSVFTFTGEMPFPGYIALLPVLGTALLILSHSTHKYSPGTLMGLRPVQFLGDNSYAIYLWHWPLMVLLPVTFHHFYWYQKIGVIGLTVVLAFFTQKLVEVRFRKFIDFSPLLSAPRFLAAGSLILLLVAGGFYQFSQLQEERSKDIPTALAQVEKSIGDSCFGSNSLTSECAAPQTQSTDFEYLAPAPVVAKDDKPEVYADDCFASQGANFKDRPVCSYGKGKTKVALVGNSHAGQWTPAVQDMAKENEWQVDTYLASRCAVMSAPQDFDSSSKSSGCKEYEDWATEQIKDGDYDLVISSNRQSLPVVGYDLAASTKPAQKSYEEVLSQWADTGAEVAVIKDTPFPGSSLNNVPDCVALNSTELGECSGSSDSWIPDDPQYEAAKKLNHPDVVAVDMNDQLCREEQCYSVVGGLVAYWDHSHLTETFAQSLSPKLESRLEKAVDAPDIFRAE